MRAMVKVYYSLPNCYAEITSGNHNPRTASRKIIKQTNYRKRKLQRKIKDTRDLHVLAKPEPREASGYFFCLEDRALFCRNCDVSIHTANAYVSAHRRFLLTGVQVGLDQTHPPSSNAKEKQSNSARISDLPSKPPPKGSSSSSMQFSGESNQLFSNHMNNNVYYGTNKSSYTGFNTVGSLPDWSVDELFEFNDFNQNYALHENGSSKADSGKLGSSDGSPYFPVDERLDMDECAGQVPEISQNIAPKIPSPPTASGLHWQRNLSYYGSDHAAFVPDITSSHDLFGYQINAKRRRQF